MLSHDLCSAPRRGLVRLPACPQCGDRLLAPLLSEHVSPRQVRNHWACESCGHTFRKSFSLSVSEPEEAYA